MSLHSQTGGKHAPSCPFAAVLRARNSLRRISGVNIDGTHSIVGYTSPPPPHSPSLRGGLRAPAGPAPPPPP